MVSNSQLEREINSQELLTNTRNNFDEILENLPNFDRIFDSGQLNQTILNFVHEAAKASGATILTSSLAPDSTLEARRREENKDQKNPLRLLVEDTFRKNLEAAAKACANAIRTDIDKAIENQRQEIAPIIAQNRELIAETHKFIDSAIAKHENLSADDVADFKTYVNRLETRQEAEIEKLNTLEAGMHAAGQGIATNVEELVNASDDDFNSEKITNQLGNGNVKDIIAVVRSLDETTLNEEQRKIYKDLTAKADELERLNGQRLEAKTELERINKQLVEAHDVAKNLNAKPDSTAYLEARKKIDELELEQLEAEANLENISVSYEKEEKSLTELFASLEAVETGKKTLSEIEKTQEQLTNSFAQSTTRHAYMMGQLIGPNAQRSMSDLDNADNYLRDEQGNLVYYDVETQAMYFLQKDSGGNLILNDDGNPVRYYYADDPELSAQIANLTEQAWRQDGTGKFFRNEGNDDLAALSEYDPTNTRAQTFAANLATSQVAEHIEKSREQQASILEANLEEAAELCKTIDANAVDALTAKCEAVSQLKAAGFETSNSLVGEFMLSSDNNTNDISVAELTPGNEPETSGPPAMGTAFSAATKQEAVSLTAAFGRTDWKQALSNPIAFLRDALPGNQGPAPIDPTVTPQVQQQQLGA